MTLLLRSAQHDDVEAMARMFSRSLRTLTFLPELHTPEEDLAFLRDKVMIEQRVTIAVQDDAILGLMAETEGWINLLYIDVNHFRCGIGSALLHAAQNRQSKLELWCFQKNHRARKFYEKHGFQAIEFTDGHKNEEKEPDILYSWRRDNHPG